ncbi:SPOR domain-containing protein [Pseudodesulfovibrio tunisiensis]|uniref:SPOR domain-containing protein n=1 Tax=Pseudodesulfovibrio tunisiensis TaxID=463192 RepID=UPI001FB389B8|nr:SPOR domain-containing protein [Pseudodesulfovibrio tunisiensis]
MKRITLTSVLTALAACMALSGCMRQHIQSAPPARTPAESHAAQPAPAPKPAPLPAPRTEEPGIIEENYTVDAPAQAEQAEPLHEADLGEENLPEARPAVSEPAEAQPEATPAEAGEPEAQATPAAEEAKAEETVAIAEAQDAAPAVEGASHYVQVGAFSDVTNANRVLARLLQDGYDGSKLVKTDDGLFRVQAGIFPDGDAAREVMEKLKAEFPASFVLTAD